MSDTEHIFSFRCRGIYSTALTKFLSENNFKVTQSSDLIRERLSLSVFSDNADITIQDMWNKQGILCWGKIEALDAFTQLLKENFLDVIIRKSKSGKDSILKGRVIAINKNNRSTILDFGDFKGILEDRIIPTGKYILTKVQFPNIGKRKAILSTNITIPGINAILIQNSTNKISKKINDPQIRQRLIQLANSIKPKNWGILWRTSAGEIIQEDENILIEEIDSLTEKSNFIFKQFKDLDGPGLILDGIPTVNVEFPFETKTKLDGIRGEIEGISTIPNHHFYKIHGEKFILLVDFVEELIHNIRPNKNQIVEEFQTYFKKFYPQEDDLIRIYHVKIDGRIFFLSPGKIISIDKNMEKITLRRELGGKTRSYYNGIGAIKEFGDYAILTCQIGNWFLKTEYFSKDNTSKGIYWNINTPIELYSNPYRIQYVDLEIDLVKRNDGQIQILDQEKLESVFMENYISDKLKQRALEQLYKLKEMVDNN